MPRWIRRLFPCLFLRRRRKVPVMVICNLPHQPLAEPAEPSVAASPELASLDHLPAPLRRAIQTASGFDFAKARPHLTDQP